MDKTHRPHAYRKGYKAGYNNPNQFDQALLLQANSPLAEGIVDGITDRAKDQLADKVKFILS